MKDQIHQFILRALSATDGEPMGDRTLKSAIRQAFLQTAFTEFDLAARIQYCEQHGWIIGTADDLSGTVWAITPKGKLAIGGLTRQA